jgi:penicillin G amidase
MATISAPVSSPRSRLRIWRVFVFFLIAILFAALGAMAWLYSIARSALPRLDGSVKTPGLAARVTVIRDGHGVPTIAASSFEDLFFAQGYVTAQDRLWQMDMMRRFAAGEISEILGDNFLKHDREQRILGLRVAAQKALAVSSPQNRSYFEAYARGVNAYMESQRDRLPLEFRLLGYAPRPWAQEDSTLIAAQMVKDLNHYPYRNALTREKILAKLGPELTADLYVNSSWHDRPPTVARPRLDQNTGDEDRDHRSREGSSVAQRMAGPSLRNFARISEADAEEQIADPPVVVGSNNWVVSGAHTVSGKPLLSNDMHLGHQMPNLWYAAHLQCGTFDVAGVTLPGLPYVIVGHNLRIAWGFTNVGPTVEDVYVENFNPDGQYLTPEGWESAEHRREVIHIKDKPDVVMDVELTRHGPIITELVPGETRKLALRWTLYDGMHAPFFEVDLAQNWEQLRRAFSALDAPEIGRAHV